jgi:hypothetical protein
LGEGTRRWKIAACTMNSSGSPRDLQDAVQTQVRERLEALAAPGFRLLTSRSGNPSTREECISIAIGSFCVTSNEIGRFDVVSAGQTAVVTRASKVSV